jgi:hypothetical protein
VPFVEADRILATDMAEALRFLQDLDIDLELLFDQGE